MSNHVAVVSLNNRPIHVVGPFPTAEAARAEGEKVRTAVEMFRLEADEPAELKLMTLTPSFDSLISSVKS